MMTLQIHWTPTRHVRRLLAEIRALENYLMTVYHYRQANTLLDTILRGIPTVELKAEIKGIYGFEAMDNAGNCLVYNGETKEYEIKPLGEIINV